ncbi:MAG: hypothetical protein HC865_15135 [Cyanobacteria bacterium RU_5_0]|nr:hypothetical protein [Cyanobacteria bacterium RU_5_0]
MKSLPPRPHPNGCRYTFQASLLTEQYCFKYPSPVNETYGGLLRLELQLDWVAQ